MFRQTISVTQSLLTVLKRIIPFTNIFLLKMAKSSKLQIKASVKKKNAPLILLQLQKMILFFTPPNDLLGMKLACKHETYSHLKTSKVAVVCDRSAMMFGCFAHFNLIIIHS